MSTLASPARIWIVEDNPADVFLVQQSLLERALAYEASVAADGERALQLIDACETNRSPIPDVVLLDLNLPRVDGLEVLRRIRRAKSLATVPVIILSSSRSPADIHETRRLGANEYVSKSMDLDTFLSVGGVISRVLADRNHPAFIH